MFIICLTFPPVQQNAEAGNHQNQHCTHEVVPSYIQLLLNEKKTSKVMTDGKVKIELKFYAAIGPKFTLHLFQK